jgi:hypothetical protein
MLQKIKPSIKIRNKYIKEPFLEFDGDLTMRLAATGPST